MLEQQKIRCLVTGDDVTGMSMVIADSHAKNISYPIPNVPELALINLWRTQTTPVKLSELAELNEGEVPLAPPKNGINFRFVDFPPDEKYIHLLQSPQIEQAWKTLKMEPPRQKKPPHPLMHRTKTVDFGIVLFGEIYLLLDKEERLMKPGDVVIQRGTNHAWSNRTHSLCRVAFILIDAVEK